MDKKNWLKGKRLSTCLLVMLSFSVVSCQEQWYVTVPDASDPSAPVICISKGKNCSGDGVIFNTLLFSQYTEDGRELERMWAIKPTENVPVKDLKYGVVPSGWRELQPARPLRLGDWYAINSHFYFRMTKVGETINNEVRSVIEFMGQAHSKRNQ